jgi:DNA-binding transcriptional LysR family regulator
MPIGPQDYLHHQFIGPVDSENRAPFYRWLRDSVPAEAVSYRVSEPSATSAAVMAGLGLGFMPIWEAEKHPDLVQVLAPMPEWESPLWIVTHVDLHRTLKVQSFLTVLKRAATRWSCA